MKKNEKTKKRLSLILIFGLIIAMALISFELRSRTNFTPTPVVDEISPEVVFTLGPLQVTTTVINTWAMVGLLSVGAYFLGRSFKVRPGLLQNAIEWLVDAIKGLITTNIEGKNLDQFFPLIFTIATFIGCANLLGLIPGLQSPTPDINTPIAMALIVFVSVPYFGIRNQGVGGYLKHYVKPYPFMLPLEIASEISRTFSLTFRLFGNILGEEIIIAILFIIAPFILPVPLMAFSIFTGILQAYIFTMLATVYIAGAVNAQEL